MIKNAANKIWEKLKSIGEAEFLDDRSSNNVSAPFWELAFLPLGILLFRFRRLLFLSFVYGVIISILAFSTKLSFVCGMSQWHNNAYFSCKASMPVYIIFFLLRLAVISVFLRVWYRTAVRGGEIDFRQMFTITLQDCKIFGAILIIIGILCLPLISFYVLADRVPNPSWKLESLFFAVASCGFWLPLLALRFFSLFACVLGGQSCPPLKAVWQRTDGNALKIIISLSLLIVLNAILFLNYNVLASFLLEQNLVFGALVGDLLYNMLFLVMFASFAGNSIIQKEALFSWYGGNPNSDSAK